MYTGLDQRSVLVTGSSAGIGRATAIAFGEEGAHVGITYYTNQEGAEETAALVEKAGGEALVTQYDLTDDDSIESTVESLTNRWGDINVLVNNAIQRNERSWETLLFEEVPADEWQTTLRSTLEGYYKTIQAVLPSMRTADWGRVVSLSSNLVDIGLPKRGPYVTAKSGLHGLTNVLAVELAEDGVLSNVVMPGFTMTEHNVTTTPQKERNEIAKDTPTQRLTTPDEVARLIVFLGSEANGHVNGEAIQITGGLS